MRQLVKYATLFHLGQQTDQTTGSRTEPEVSYADCTPEDSCLCVHSIRTKSALHSVFH